MKSLKFFIFLYCFIFFSIHADTVVVQHNGANNPATEGWYLRLERWSSASPIYNDQGYNAWRIYDESTSSGTHQYAYDISSALAVESAQLGWTMSMRIKVMSLNAPNDSIYMAYIDHNSRLWHMRFGSSGSNPMAQLYTGPGLYDGPGYVVQGGQNQYHLYELKYDPDKNAADLYVNGLLAISNYNGVNMVGMQPLLSWGANHESGTGSASYNLVSFSQHPEETPEPEPQVPEPGVLIYMLIACIFSLYRKYC
ncbi:MAG: hypothetical protein HUU50_12095 [Candidatus Brocadiae bacterium]|nr:hypothetical protein [Candidatus Brocadiia bacterium]